MEQNWMVHSLKQVNSIYWSTGNLIFNIKKNDYIVTHRIDIIDHLWVLRYKEKWGRQLRESWENMKELKGKEDWCTNKNDKRESLTRTRIPYDKLHFCPFISSAFLAHSFSSSANKRKRGDDWRCFFPISLKTVLWKISILKLKIAK